MTTHGAANDRTKPLTDDEMERNARANFDRLEDQSSLGSKVDLNRGGRGRNSDEEMDELFSDLLSASQAEPAATGAAQRQSQKRFQRSQAQRDAMNKAKADAQEYYEENLVNIRRWSAKQQREKYALERAVEGKNVRTYNFHNHAIPAGPESYEDRERRLHKERARNYRGVTPETVRKHTDLSGLSEEARLQHKRDGAARRKRESRAKLKALGGKGSTI